MAAGDNEVGFVIMRFHSRCLLAVLGAVLPWLPLHAAEGEAPVPVVLRHAGTDPVGFVLAAAVSQRLGATPEVRQVSDTAAPRVVLIVTTVDGSVEDPGKQTAAAINVLYDADTLPLNGYLVTGLVQVCGITRAEACAEEIVATLLAAVARLRSSNPELASALLSP
ncbi:MAG: hypothetical protein ABL964_00530 [Steroidobacteraceae bacterium]